MGRRGRLAKSQINPRSLRSHLPATGNSPGADLSTSVDSSRKKINVFHHMGGLWPPWKEKVNSAVDFVQRTVSLTTIAPAQTWLDRWMRLTATVAHAKVLNGDSKRVAISPDSSTLYAIGLHTETNDSDGTLQMTETPLGLTVIDATTGIEIALLDTQASDIQLSPDGSELYLVHWEQTDQPSTDVLDTATLALKQTIVGQSLMEVNSIDGAPHYIGTAPFASRTVISTLDTTSWEVTSSWSISGWVEWGLP